MDEKKYVIHGYKHDGTLYKIWDEAILLEETDDYYVFGNSGTKVRKNYGSSWTTRETAILVYFKKNWFNIVAQLKRNGIHYYCNIASPAIIEDNAIKFIDYDLDLRIYPDGK
jgi:protein associated with RNAse G/E